MQLSEPELINRYKTYYAIPTEVPVSQEMILTHWDLEKRLTQELLASRPENRWEIFDRCYSELFGKLPWLNDHVQMANPQENQQRYRNWKHLIGNPPQRIYEIGSGKAELITFLAQAGFDCRATEITRERGQKNTTTLETLSWGISDGIHLDRFEKLESFDVALSDGVIEHLHPDDVVEHFKGVRQILAPGGKYIFRVPHRCAGPCDVSWVFGYSKAIGMHLWEFTYREMEQICREAGFVRMEAVLTLPPRFANVFGREWKPVASAFYLHYLICLERLFLLIPPSRVRRQITRMARLALFSPAIFMRAYKP